MNQEKTKINSQGQTYSLHFVNDSFISKFCVVFIFLMMSGISLNIYANGDGSVKRWNIQPGEINKIVTNVMTKSQIPGLSIAIAYPDGTIFAKSYGYANLEHNILMKTDSVFEIGSVSKMLTAICIMILQEEGLLSVNDSLSKYFPQFPNGEKITIKNLLQHTSGIKDVTKIAPFSNNQMKNWTPQQIVLMLKSQPLDFEPGQQARYSNSGFILLGLIVEKVSGISFGNFLKKRVLEPLGMTHSLLGSNALIISNRVAGYTLTGKGDFLNAEYASISAPYASGGVMSTPADLIKLTKVFSSGTFLNDDNIKEMFAPVRLNNGNVSVLSMKNMGWFKNNASWPIEDTDYTFGYGLDMLKYKNNFIPGKTGGISGFHSYFVYYKDLNLTIALIANCDETLDDLIYIAQKIPKLPRN